MVAVRDAAGGVDRLARSVSKRDPQTAELLGRVDDLYLDAKSALEFREWVIAESMAFYVGHQWGQATPWGYDETDATGEAQEVYNYILPTVRSQAAQMMRSYPSPKVVSSHDGHSARVRARATTLLVRSVMRDGTLPYEEVLRAVVDAGIKGASWLKTYFDPTEGEVKTQLKFKPKLGGGWEIETDGSGAPVTVDQFQGKILVEYHDIVDVLPDPAATRLREVRYLFHRRLVPRSTLDDEFPVDHFGVKTENRWTALVRDRAMMKRDAIENGQRGLGPFGRGARAEGNELCELVEYWEKPTRKHPQGRLVVYQGDVLIASSALPYEWPWTLVMGQNVVPNALYPIGVVHPLKPMQRTINLNGSKKKEWMDKLLNPPWLVPFEAELEEDHITDIAGGILNYRTGHKPEIMNVPNIPQSAFELERAMVEIIKDISTVNDVSRGDGPPGNPTGRALSYLDEFQQGVREPDIMLFRMSLVDVLKKILRLVRDYYPDGRVLRLLGPNNLWMTRAFRRDDYDLDAELVFEMDQGPTSRALRLSERTQLFQIGVYGDDPAAVRFRQQNNIDVEDSSTIDVSEVNRRRAVEQIDGILSDPTYPLQAFEQEDHQVFLEELDYFRVTDEYFQLPPDAQARVDVYYQAHEMMALEQEQNQMARQAQTGNGGTPAANANPASAGVAPGSGMPSPADGGVSDAEAAQPEAFEAPQGQPGQGVPQG